MAGIVSFIMIAYHSAKDNITTQDGKRDKNTAKGYKILVKEDSYCRAEFKANETKSSVLHHFCQQILKSVTEFTKVRCCTFLLFIQKFVKKYV